MSRAGGARWRPALFRCKEHKMKRIRKAARITSVIAAAILTALVVTVLCAPEEDRIALTEALDSLSDSRRDAGRQIDSDSLPAEVIAWVEVPDTGIDEPIVQATPDSPSAYLHRDVFGQGAYGTPYIDSDCTSRFQARRGLRPPYVRRDCVRRVRRLHRRGIRAGEHSRIIVYKRSGEALELEVCAVDVVNASRERLVINQEESLEKIVGAADLRLSDPAEAEQLFAFTTCSYQTNNSRTVVYAARAM